MDRIQTLGFLTIETTDLDAAVDFYTRVARLEISERRDDEVFLTGGTEHHWIRLQRGAASGVSLVSYKVADHETLDALEAAIQAAGIETTGGGDLRTDRIDRSIRFTDPAGIPVELFVDQSELSGTPFPAGVELDCMLHTVWRIPHFEETLAFYQGVLGFEISDWIERNAVFLRCGDRYHHSLALGRAKPGERLFDHLCIQVGSIDDVMRIRHNAAALDVPIDRDLLRHGPSGSISIYLVDPIHGHMVEFCTGHGQISDPTYTPRTLPAAIDSVDIWRRQLPERGNGASHVPSWARPGEAEGT